MYNSITTFIGGIPMKGAMVVLMLIIMSSIIVSSYNWKTWQREADFEQLVADVWTLEIEEVHCIEVDPFLYRCNVTDDGKLTPGLYHNWDNY
jgi:hypothetical protein